MVGGKMRGRGRGLANPPSYANSEKMKLLALHTHDSLRTSLTQGSSSSGLTLVYIVLLTEPLRMSYSALTLPYHVLLYVNHISVSVSASVSAVCLSVCFSVCLSPSHSLSLCIFLQSLLILCIHLCMYACLCLYEPLSVFPRLVYVSSGSVSLYLSPPPSR